MECRESDETGAQWNPKLSSRMWAPTGGVRVAANAAVGTVGEAEVMLERETRVVRRQEETAAADKASMEPAGNQERIRESRSGGRVSKRRGGGCGRTVVI
jgi:hypothetical protein